MGNNHTLSIPYYFNFDDFYGLQSALFRVNSPDNCVSRVVIQYCLFSKIFSRNYTSRSELMHPLILSIDENNLQTQTNQVIIRNNEFKDITF